MTDPLAGMSVKEARELVEKFKPNEPSSTWNKLLALAALGAECVGAERGECVGVERIDGTGVYRVCTNVVGDVPLGAAVLVLKEDR